MSESVSVERNEEMVQTKSPSMDGMAPASPVTVSRNGNVRIQTGPTVESVLYGVIGAMAFVLRFLGLGSLQPLSPFEAGQTWSAWLDAMGRQTEVLTTAYSPLLYSVQRFLFWLTDGGSDAWARAFPALVGSLLVLVPWTLRRQVGRSSALVLSLLFAVDPWLLTFSRMSDGAILTIASGLLLWSALLNGRQLSKVQLRLVAVVAALFVLSGPLAWLFLPLLLGTAILFPPAFALERQERTWLLSLFIGTLVIVGTGWLAYWQGLGIVSSSLTVALSYLTGESSYPSIWPFLRLLVDQPLLAIFGVAGLGALWQEARWHRIDRRWALLLTGWTLYALVLLIFPARNPVLLVLLSLPLALAAASLISRLLRFGMTDTDWQDGSLIVVTLVVLLVTSFFLTASYMAPGAFDARLLLFYLILPALVAFFVWWSGWRTTAQVTGLVLVGVFLAATVSSALMLNLRSELRRGNALFAQTTEGSVRLLADDVAKLNAIRIGDPGMARVLIVVGEDVQPVLGWYLRFVQDLRFVDAIDPALFDGHTLAIGDPAQTLTLPVAAVGSDYSITSSWLPTQLQDWGARLRWAFFRELRELPARESVVLWVQEE